MNHDPSAPRMVPVSEGEFMMGAGAGDKFANDTERPAHPVRVAAFAIGLTPVTVREFRAFRPILDEDADSPAVHVSWTEAREYCAWLSDRCARPYRLPSEAEWEYACRAGTVTPFSCGSELSAMDANFFYSENGTRIGPGARTPVGAYPANAFGLHDMHGNICEWVADTWRPNYREPGDEETRRVIRGGAWDGLPRLLRSSWRDGLPIDTRRDNLGLRVATSDLR